MISLKVRWASVALRKASKHFLSAITPRERCGEGRGVRVKMQNEEGKPGKLPITRKCEHKKYRGGAGGQRAMAERSGGDTESCMNLNYNPNA